MAEVVAIAAGWETGGLQEAYSTTGICAASTANASLLNNDNYHLRLTDTSNVQLQAPAIDTSGGYYLRATFESNNLIDIQPGDLISAGTNEGGGSVEIRVATEWNITNDLVLKNANGTEIDRVLNVWDTDNVPYVIELYWEKSATGAWEWWINGTSRGSGTSDFDGGVAAGVNWVRLDNPGPGASDIIDWADLFLVHGATSSTRIGNNSEVLNITSDGGTPTTGGTALTSGSWTNTQAIPVNTSLAQYLSSGSAKSGWLQTDGTASVTIPGPSGQGLTKIVAAKLSVVPNLDASAVTGEDLAPDTIAVQTNLSGAVTDIDEDPDSPDANWLTASGSSVLRVTFPTPTVNPNSTQERFRAWVRRSGNTTTQTLYGEGTPSVTGYASNGSSVLDAINETQDGFGTSWLYGTSDDPSINQLDFPTPSLTPSGNQTVRVYCAKSDPPASTINNGLGGTPTIQINIYDSGGIHHTGSAQNVTTSAWISEVFTATGLDAASMYVECLTVTDGGGPNKASVAIDSVEWVVAGSAQTVSYNLEVWESGVKVSGITGQTGNITSVSGEMLTFTWDSSQLGTASGANVELYLDQTAGTADFIEIGAVEWTTYNGVKPQVYLGNSVDGVTLMEEGSSVVGNDAGYQNWGAWEEWYSNDPDVVANTDEYCRLGFGVTAGQGGDSYDAIFAMVVHAPNATWSIFPTGGSFPPYNVHYRFRHLLVR